MQKLFVIMNKFRITVGGFSVNIELKNMRTIRLRIKPDGIYLSAPHGTTMNTLREFVIRHAEWIRRNLNNLRNRANYEEPHLSGDEIKTFIDTVKPRLEYWQSIMNLNAQRISFKLMKSRWGSCNPLTRSISINLRLCRYPAECTDYIIVHELAHMVHHNHSADFWALVEKYIPRWRDLRKRLRGTYQ